MYVYAIYSCVYTYNAMPIRDMPYKVCMYMPYTREQVGNPCVNTRFILYAKDSGVFLGAFWGIICNEHRHFTMGIEARPRGIIDTIRYCDFFTVQVID